MPKVYGLHEMKLEPGQDPDEFERFWRDEVAPLPDFPGWKTQLLKSDRGPRAGTYLVLFEIESVEARDRFFPGPNEETSEEFDKFYAEHPDAAAAWKKLTGFDAGEAGSDFLVIG